MGVVFDEPGGRCLHDRPVARSSGRKAAAVLRDFRGVVVADGYGAYAALARGAPGFQLAHCWAHVRRKFFELAAFFPAASQEALDRIMRYLTSMPSVSR